MPGSRKLNVRLVRSRVILRLSDGRRDELGDKVLSSSGNIIIIPGDVALRIKAGSMIAVPSAKPIQSITIANKQVFKFESAR